MKWTFFIIAWFAVSAYGQIPARISNDAEGYSFMVPKGFTGQASGEGFAFVNDAKTIILVVKSHSYRDMQAFIADANFERDGLELVGKPQAIAGGSTFRTAKRTDRGIVVIDTSVVFTPAGGGVMVVAMADEANSAAAFEASVETARGVLFTEAKPAVGDDRIRGLLAGKNLLYLYTGNGYSERKDILLCASGRFYQSTGMGGFDTKDVDGPSFAATGGRSGTWAIAGGGTRLVLRFGTGAVTSYNISARQASNEIGLNGQRFFVQNQTKCQ